MKIFQIILSISLLLSVTFLGATDIDINKENATYLDKFHAHTTVNKLTVKNLKSLDFINVISENFGYVNGDELRKDYISAKTMILKRNIVGAKNMMIKNEKDIKRALQRLSLKYKADTTQILNQSVDKVSMAKLDVYVNNNDKMMKIFKKNRLRMEVAYESFKDAEQAFKDNNFKNSINLYRVSKKHAINIMKDLAKPEKKEEIIERYKIHIVDNRQQIFKKNS